MMRSVVMDSNAPFEVLTRNSLSTVEWKSKDFRRCDRLLAFLAWLLLPFMIGCGDVDFNLSDIIMPRRSLMLATVVVCSL